MNSIEGIKVNRSDSTREQHLEIGARLGRMSDELRWIWLDFMQAHFTKASSARKRARRIILELQTLRHELDQLAGLDLSRETLSAQEPYFPAPKTDLGDFRKVLLDCDPALKDAAAEARFWLTQLTQK